jgi:hypothetical protein
LYSIFAAAQNFPTVSFQSVYNFVSQQDRVKVNKNKNMKMEKKNGKPNSQCAVYVAYLYIHILYVHIYRYINGVPLVEISSYFSTGNADAG